MLPLQRILNWINKNIPVPRNDIRTNWEKAREEGKAIRKEIQELSERPKERPDSTESWFQADMSMKTSCTLKKEL